LFICLVGTEKLASCNLRAANQLFPFLSSVSFVVFLFVFLGCNCFCLCAQFSN